MRCRWLLAALLCCVPVLRAGDPAALDARCKEIAKKLATPAKLSELGVKPFQQAPDDVRKRFLERHADVKLTDDNRAIFASVVARKDPLESIRVGAVGWLAKLPANKLATKTLTD